LAGGCSPSEPGARPARGRSPITDMRVTVASRVRERANLLTRELLDAIVVPVRDVDVSRGVHGDAPGVLELPVPGSGAAPRGEEGPRAGEPLDAIVGHVGDVDVPRRVHGDTPGEFEL